MGIAGDFTQAEHEHFMRAAIEQGRHNAAWPFGAVIVEIDSRQIVARGFNQSIRNKTLHGEIVAYNNYVEAFGQEPMDRRVLYTTAEPCPMCMGALIWASLGGVVYGTSITRLIELGIRQITIGAEQLCAQADFYQGGVIGGILAEETDRLFRDRSFP